MRLLVLTVLVLVTGCGAFGGDVHTRLEVGSTGTTDTDEITILSILDDPPVDMAPFGEDKLFWGVQASERPKGTFGGPGCWGLETSTDEGSPLRPVLGEEDEVTENVTRAGEELVRVVGFLLPSGSEPKSLIFDRSCFRDCGGPVMVEGCRDKIYFDAE